jgi:hypothetical protein
MHLERQTGWLLAVLFCWALAAHAATPAAATAPAPAPGKAVAFDTYQGYFVANTFEPKAERSLVVCRDQAAFEKVFHPAVVMNDRAHRLPAGVFEKSLVIAAIRRGPRTDMADVRVVALDGTLTVSYSATQAAPGSATFATPLILSVPREAVKRVKFVENGQAVGEQPLE